MNKHIATGFVTAVVAGALSVSVAQQPVSADLQRMAFEFESALDQGHLQLTPDERSSLIEAAVAFAPELQANPRIAATDEAIADNGPSGFYGGVYFGPIADNERQIHYLKLTIWGNPDLGWKFDHLTRHIAVQPRDHPTWLRLVEPVTERQATEAIRQLREFAESADTDAKMDLTTRELDLLHRFEQHFAALSDLERPDRAPWYSNHFVISAYSQTPGSRPNDYVVAVNFAVVGNELRFIDLRRDR